MRDAQFREENKAGGLACRAAWQVLTWGLKSSARGCFAASTLLFHRQQLRSEHRATRMRFDGTLRPPRRSAKGPPQASLSAPLVRRSFAARVFLPLVGVFLADRLRRRCSIPVPLPKKAPPSPARRFFPQLPSLSSLSLVGGLPSLTFLDLDEWLAVRLYLHNQKKEENRGNGS